ncbi:putative zeaxanthin epoxidase [Helianthus anomalus]
MAKKEMAVVKGIDLELYMGRNGENTRATYTLNEDGTVHVLNETWSYDKRDYIEGTAYKADPKSDEAKLKVKFYVPPFLPIIPVVGDYWVLYLDQDYTYALIGEPRRKYLWVCFPFIYLIIYGVT